ncbi:MAG: hypothetical protein QOC81_3936 [Thermoanaerobaculia bacterium]|jgi:hypothetical protein|nr:hypothetical protein [Thermoanaerobaculia bacterium]
MKKNALPDDDEMPAEFDFTKSIPNPWFVAMHGPEYVRVIDKDLAALFPDNDSMNAALRSIAQAAARVPQKISARTAAAPRVRKKVRA